MKSRFLPILFIYEECWCWKRVLNHPWEAQLLPSSLPPCPTEEQEPSLCFPWAQWIRLICSKEKNSAFWRSLSDCGVGPSKTTAGGDWTYSSKPCMTWGNDLGTRTISRTIYIDSSNIPGRNEGDTIHHPTTHILGWDLLPPVSFKQKMPSEDIFRAPVISGKELSLRGMWPTSHTSCAESQNLLVSITTRVKKVMVSTHHVGRTLLPTKGTKLCWQRAGKGWPNTPGVRQRRIISPRAPSPRSKASSSLALTSLDFCRTWVLTLSELCFPWTGQRQEDIKFGELSVHGENPKDRTPMVTSASLDICYKDTLFWGIFWLKFCQWEWHSLWRRQRSFPGGIIISR